MLIETRVQDDPELVALVTAQQRELAEMEGEGWFAFTLHEDIEYLLGSVDGEPVACGALQGLGDGIGEIKRMYVVPDRRRTGLSRLILVALEDLARRNELHTLRLETNLRFTAAVGLYTANGYAPIPLFGQYLGSSRSACFEKRLLSGQ